MALRTLETMHFWKPVPWQMLLGSWLWEVRKRVLALVIFCWFGVQLLTNKNRCIILLYIIYHLYVERTKKINPLFGVICLFVFFVGLHRLSRPILPLLRLYPFPPSQWRSVQSSSTISWCAKSLAQAIRLLRTQQRATWNQQKCKSKASKLGGGFKYFFFMFTPTWGKWSNLTNIFKGVETTN